MSPQADPVAENTPQVLPRRLSDIILPAELPPLVLVAHRRPHLLKQVLEGLLAQTVIPKVIYAYLDGPKDETDLPKVQAVREVIESFPSLNIQVVSQEKNLGCTGNSVLAISETLARHESIIMLEEDMYPVRHFYEVMCKLLTAYQPFEQVFSVASYAWHQEYITETIETDFFITNYASSWGVGLWRDRWNALDLKTITSLGIPYPSPMAIPPYPSFLSAILYLAGDPFRPWDFNDWTVVMAVHSLYHGKVSIGPCGAMVRNIGFDSAEAFHTNFPEPGWINARYSPDVQPDTLPETLAVTPSFLRPMPRWRIVLILVKELANEKLWAFIAFFIRRPIVFLIGGEHQLYGLKKKYKRYCETSSWRWLLPHWH